MDISDANALVAEVMAGRTFYSVVPPRKTGIMPTVAIVAANDNYPAGYHAGNVGGLDAIDVDLAPANIKSGATIFGKLGTYTGANPDHDAQNGSNGIPGATAANISLYTVLDASGDLSLINDTVTVVAGACIEAFGAATCYCSADAVAEKMRLFVGGVQRAESGFLAVAFTAYSLKAYVENNGAGAKALEVTIHNYSGVAKGTGQAAPAVFGGGVKTGV